MNGALHVLVDEAIKRAIGFLLYSRDLRGLWSDFRLPVGESSGWVTGFVGSVLAGTGDDRVIGEKRDVWNAFAAQKLFTGHGGWGYNLLTPEVTDHRSLFTTAAALDSLLCYQKTYHGTIKPEAL